MRSLTTKAYSDRAMFFPLNLSCRASLHFAMVFIGAMTLTAAIGCNARPTLGIDAEIGSDKPLALNLAATQPVTLNAAIGMDKPLSATITIEGLAVPYEGTFVTEALFNQINENDSAEYVAAIFGKPDYETVLGDGTTVWRWKYRPTAQIGSLFSLIGGGEKKEPSPDHITAFAIFKEGKLTRKWRG